MESIREPSLTGQLKLWGSVIRFSHSVFALPFALSMFVVLSRDYPITAEFLAYIVIAVVSARTAAMGFNRLADAGYDARNPRTATREIPRGLVTRRSVWALVTLSSVVFLASAAALGWHCFILAPVVLAILFLYSLTKRFTGASHFVLGLALAMAPGGVWYAITGSVAWQPLWFMAAVLLWVSGFDILYACQDVEFDRREGLYSIPSRIGIAWSLRLARILHLLSVLCLFKFGLEMGLGAGYYAGVVLFSVCVLSQHTLISAIDLTRIDAAFFTRNGVASILFFCCVLLDRIWAVWGR